MSRTAFVSAVVVIVVVIGIVAVRHVIQVHRVRPLPSAMKVVQTTSSTGAVAEKNIADGQKVKQLYATILGLPAAPHGKVDCPSATGAGLNSYQITFTKAQTVVLSAKMQPGGCEVLKLSNGKQVTAYGSHKFWEEVKQDLGG